MFYNTLKIDDIVDYKENKVDKKILLEENNARFVAFALKKGEMLGEHHSETDACAYVYDGEVEFHFDAEEFTLKRGEMIMFKKNDTHSVYANKDSKFLLIAI